MINITQRNNILIFLPTLNLQQLHKNKTVPSDWPAHQGKTLLSQGPSISFIFTRLNDISVSFYFLALSSQEGDPAHTSLWTNHTPKKLDNIGSEQ